MVSTFKAEKSTKSCFLQNNRITWTNWNRIILLETVKRNHVIQVRSKQPGST